METVNEFLDKLAGQGVKLSVEAGQLNCYAQKGALTPVIRDGITKHRTEIISLLGDRKRRPATNGDYWVRESVKEFPLSAGQKGLYILQKLHPGMGAYNVPVCVRIKRGLDAALLAKAWDYVLEQYPILTARVVEREGALYQRLDDDCRTTIQHRSIELADDRQLLALLRTWAKQPFDPNQGPLTRIELFNWGGPESILLLTVHHLVIDGTSAMILLRSFLQFYQQLFEGKPVRPSRDLPGYQEFVAWEAAMLASPEGEAHASYWRKQLAGELPIVELVPDRPGSESAAFEGKTLAEQIPEGLSQWVREYSKARSLPASVIFLALFQLVLHKYTDQEDIIVGMPVMGRAGQKFLGDVGYFINMVPLRTRCEPGLKLGEFFRRVQATMLDALFHSSYPFPLMLETLQINEVRKNPVFQVTYAYQNFINQDTFAPLMQRQTLDIVSIPELTQEGESDLGLEVFEEGPVFSMQLKYNPEMYTDEAIRRLFESYYALLKGVSEDSDRPLPEYSIISAREKERVLVDFNDTRAEYRTDQCLHELFADSIARYKEKVAVVSGDQQLTFEQLDTRSNELALYLQSEGIGPDRLVGVCMERSLEMVVSLVATLRAGGAYVPLDPDYPDERLAYMLQDSRPPIVLTQEKLQERVGALMQPETQVVALDRQWRAVDERIAALTAKGVALEQRVQPHHLAYVIYTSGSTGQPKGVMNEHRGIVNRLIWMQEAYGLGTDDVVLQKTPFSFDVSVWEFFWPLLAGARLVMARPEGHKDPQYLVDTIDGDGITTLHFVPSMLQIFLEHVAPPKCGSVKRVICSGEALPSMVVQRFAERLPHARLHNLYGPTEAAVDVTAWPCPAENIPTLIPIGRPIANTQIYILDRYGTPVPVGVVGELHIAGVQVARGYLNRPQLTEERFVPDPFAPVAGARMYKTGDLARWRDDGTIEYLGRNDFQVKLRGFRIELGEVEARLTEHEGVQEAVVLAREDTPGEKRLVAYFTPSPEHASSVARFLRIRKTDAGAAAKYATLPDGSLVFHQNQSETDFLYEEIFGEDVYLKRGIALNDGDCIFDVGANIGLFSLFVFQRCPNATIYAFEPIPKVFESLQLNATLYGWRGRMYQCGLAETSQQQVFTFYPHNTVISSSMTSREEARQIVKSYMLNQQEGSSGAGDEALAHTDEVLEARLDTEEFTCELRPLSDIIRENGIERIDLLKIDVEKAEQEVLRGIQDEDWPKIRQLAVEVHDVAGRLAETIGMLEALGYEVSHDQSEFLESTGLYNVYAVRRTEARSSAGESRGTGHAVAEKVWHSPEFLIRDLRGFLSECLPDYMVPAAFVPLDEMPLTPNGKLDRKALPAPEVGAFGSGRYEAPQTEIEAALAAIWSDLLKIERVGRHDEFFELGGHSLLATQLISRIHTQMGFDLPLKTVFDQTTVAQQATCIAKAEQSTIPPIEPVDRAQFEPLPLSFAEERVWFMTELVPEGAPVYSVPGAFVIRGELDLDQLDEAYNLIIARHETLRTIFPIHDGQTHRVILDRLDFKFRFTDLSQYDQDVREARAKEICLADARTPFDLTSGPLIRGNVVRLAEHEHIVLVNMHHMITDGWSIRVLVKEFRAIMDALRRGRRPELPPLPIQYVDYAIWQRQWLEQGGLLEKQLAYWRGKLAGLPERLDLTTDYPRPSVLGVKGATRLFTMEAQLVADLKRLGERRGATLYMVLLAAFKALLHRYTGQSDICLGGLIANRNYAATEGLIGMFVNSLGLRSQVEGDDTFVALLSKVRATCLEAYENQDAPFPKVVEALQLRRNPSLSPLFQILFFLQSAEYMGELDQKTQRYFMDTGFAKFEISVELTETPEGLDGGVEYNTDLYKPQSIARMIEHFVTLCRAVAGNPTARIRDLDYVGEAEKSRALVELNAARADYPKDRCLHELFVEQVARHSDHPAIVCGDEPLTYQQLYERSHDLALYLQWQGVGPDSLVGLCMDRSLDMVVGLLAILQAGGAYVPLDPNYPDERLAYMVRDSQATIVLTQEKLREKLRGLVRPETRLVSLDAQMAEIGERVAELKANGAPLHQDVEPHHLAYVIYTSGSTGQPKGVAIEHHSPVTLVHWAREVYSREELAGVLASTSICFDLSVFEIFVTLASGGTIILVPNAMELVSLANRESVTLINTVPSAMEELVRLGTIPDSVQTINLAGEPLSARLVDKIYDTSGVKKVYDLYGPSEATTYSTYVLRTKNGPQTIGRPIVNTQVYILDKHHQIQPIGVPGELYIAGDGLAREYLNRPELTQEKFVANPFEPGTRMYKTGDRGRWLDDGNIQYLGRIDTQVKVRGFRIEPGEIEARLNQGIGILDSAVVAQGEGADKRLIAFYRAEGTTADHIVHLPNEELRAHLLRTLPDHMVPAAFVSLAAIPLSSSGKVDRGALERMDVKMTSDREYVAPRNATEEQLGALFAGVLKLAPEKVGIRDSFFELGGHSLSAVQLISRINERFKRSIPLLSIFTSPNVAAFAELLSSEETTSDDLVVPIQTGGDALPIFGIPGAGGIVLSLQPLSRALGKNQPFYALQGVGLDGTTAPLNSVEETAEANIGAVKKVQPRGPYRFVGHSYGGVIAYEMARQLLERGEEVASLTLLDSPAPWIVQTEGSRDEAAELSEVYVAFANLYGADVKLDLTRLRKSDDAENVRYLVALLSDSGHEIREEQFAAFRDVYRTNLRCYRTYKPSPLPRAIDVSLYRATEREATWLGDYGWSYLLQSPIRAYDVEGNHRSILEKVQFDGVGRDALSRSDASLIRSRGKEDPLEVVQIGGRIRLKMESAPNTKAGARERLDRVRGRLIDLSHRIHANPELGFEEEQASTWLAEALTAGGFEVKKGICDLPTAFVARAGTGPLHVAIFAEYDSLPGIGHACGHNLIAAMAVGAGIAAARVADDVGLTVSVIGSPAEEVGDGGGKILLLERGALAGVHAAMMVHPSPLDIVETPIVAATMFDVRYTGKEAHAAAFPEMGINAADALTIAQTAIGLLRQHIRPTDRVHGIITKGGDSPNVVPAHTAARYMVRGQTLEELDEIRTKVVRCFEAGALATGAKLEIVGGQKPYTHMRHDADLAAAYQRNAEALGRFFSDLGPAIQRVAASTDMGNVSLVLPALHPMIGIGSLPAINHQPEFTAHCVTAAADKAVMDGALAMAWTAIDIATDAKVRDRLMNKH